MEFKHLLPDSSNAAKRLLLAEILSEPASVRVRRDLENRSRMRPSPHKTVKPTPSKHREPVSSAETIPVAPEPKPVVQAAAPVSQSPSWLQGLATREMEANSGARNLVLPMKTSQGAEEQAGSSQTPDNSASNSDKPLSPAISSAEEQATEISSNQKTATENDARLELDGDKEEDL